MGHRWRSRAQWYRSGQQFDHPQVDGHRWLSYCRYSGGALLGHTVAVRRVRDRSGRRWWGTAAVAVIVALGAGTWWMLARDARSAEIATVLALPATILSLGAAVLTTVVALRAGGAGGTTLLSAARQLAGVVRAQEAAALARLVADTGETRPADVVFAQPGLIYWRSDGGGPRGSLTQIEPFYRGLGRGRLVVLGEAGAGKTVLVIQLIRMAPGPNPDSDGSPGKRVSRPAAGQHPANTPVCH